jgi:hypothetical protein
MSVVNALSASARPLGLKRVPGSLRDLDASARLAVSVPLQEQGQWCWAAITVGVAVWYDAASTWTQCRVVGATLGTECCATPDCFECDQQWYLHEALAVVRHGAGWGDGPLAAPSLVKELKRKNPVGARIDWNDGTGHFVLVTGFDPNSGEVTVEDPARGRLTMHYDVLASAYLDRGSWSHYYLLTR